MTIPWPSKLPNASVGFSGFMTWFKTQKLVRFWMVTLCQAPLPDLKFVGISFLTNILLNDIKFLVLVSAVFAGTKLNIASVFEVHTQILSCVWTKLIFFQNPSLFVIVIVAFPNVKRTSGLTAAFALNTPPFFQSFPPASRNLFPSTI